MVTLEQNDYENLQRYVNGILEKRIAEAETLGASKNPIDSARGLQRYLDLSKIQNELYALVPELKQGENQ